MANIDRSAATAAPEPLLEPPVSRAVSQGFRGTGQGSSVDTPPYASSCIACLPSRMAPASSSRRTTVASLAGRRSRKVGEFAVVGIPAVS
jgi:hypothetical protein